MAPARVRPNTGGFHKAISSSRDIPFVETAAGAVINAASAITVARLTFLGRGPPGLRLRREDKVPPAEGAAIARLALLPVKIEI